MRAFEVKALAGLEHLARGCALLAGALLTGVALLTCASIIGRQWFGASLQGDFELSGAAAGVAIALLMPICHLRGGNIMVDAFTTRVSTATQARLDRLGALGVAMLMGLLAWRTAVGGASAWANHSASMLMECSRLAGLCRHGAALCADERHCPAPQCAGTTDGSPGMSPLALAGLIFGLMLLLMALRVPIAVSMFAAGAAGYALQAGWDPLANFLSNQAFARFANYDLSVIPLFILMGHFATQGGISRALFAFASALMRRFHGGLAMASVLASAGFGAICGSSVATAATMTSVALPELRRQGYSGRLATATLARRHAGHSDSAVGAAGHLCHPG